MKLTGRGTVPRLREQLYRNALDLFVPPSELLRFMVRVEKAHNMPKRLKRLIALERLAKQENVSLEGL